MPKYLRYYLYILMFKVTVQFALRARRWELAAASVNTSYIKQKGNTARNDGIALLSSYIIITVLRLR